MKESLIKLQMLSDLINIEPYVICSFLLLGAWVFYKLFLKEVSQERHRNLLGHFSSLIRHFVILTVGFLTYILIEKASVQSHELVRILPYPGILTLVWGIIVFVKTCRLWVLQYLFLGSMREGVPVLIVNIFSLVLTLILGFWTLSHVFGIQLAPLLATSAAFSLILGLALQDTLGNLFAGISLQIDHAFEIGDWLEITNGPQKMIGQVHEISWRSTNLIGWTDEIITVPNRIMAQASIANFSTRGEPIVRSQVFRLAYSVNQELAKSAMLTAVRRVKEVKSYPSPLVIVTETTESWLMFKLVYFIENYGSQYIIGDKVLFETLSELKKNGIETTVQTHKIIQS